MCLGTRDWKWSARRDGQPQSAQAWPFRRQLLLRPSGHDGAGALVRKLARLRQTGANGGPSRHRVHPADRTMEGIWRRHRLPGRDVGDGDLGLRALSQDRAANCVRNRACAADPATYRRQRVRHRRHIGEGRFGLNVVCGWNEGEFEMFGATLRDHEARYEYAQEWLDIVKLAWSPHQDFDFDGRFFQLKGVRAKPKPYGGTRPLIMNAGASATGQAFAIRNCDALFSTISRGISFEETARHVSGVQALAQQAGRNIDVYTVGVVTCRPTEREAQDYYQH